ncbi:hypothetical protein SAMN05421810_103421 [Amycolatopsis arida]|uniref:Uncharacterized protein n=1 Tax=Amycolatopsis arida TaxID=587909 RepID=A0A1I5T7E9_9PSEU|nr:hypothetical protein [Amycolatopsis arida]TDX96200.1 hypothetical protein CLV69_103337 [Amycolatopsis arida]SFP78955.1 hypothetical protein SAMN05421810_103421 [Amycolatopsis arida]
MSDAHGGSDYLWFLSGFAAGMDGGDPGGGDDTVEVPDAYARGLAVGRNGHETHQTVARYLDLTATNPGLGKPIPFEQDGRGSFRGTLDLGDL